MAYISCPHFSFVGMVYCYTLVASTTSATVVADDDHNDEAQNTIYGCGSIDFVFLPICCDSLII